MASPVAPTNTLRSLLAELPRAPGEQTRVWFAPYTTYPETGFVESLARRGVYDTFLAIPKTGLAANYGATKLTAADTLFSLASAYGLSAELRLAQRLGFEWFALDLGAVNAPEAAFHLCRSTPGCRLSGDAYALFPINQGGAELERRLGTLTRRMPLLPQQSAGASWGPLVFAPLQWSPPALRGTPAPRQDPWLVVPALPRERFELYRYPLAAYPKAVQPWLRMGGADVQLVLAPDIQALQLCIGTKRGPCKLVTLRSGVRRRLAIGDLLPPGQASRIEIVAVVRAQPGQSPFSLEMRVPGAATGLLGHRMHRQPFQR